MRGLVADRESAWHFRAKLSSATCSFELLPEAEDSCCVPRERTGVLYGSVKLTGWGSLLHLLILHCSL